MRRRKRPRAGQKPVRRRPYFDNDPEIPEVQEAAPAEMDFDYPEYPDYPTGNNRRVSGILAGFRSPGINKIPGRIQTYRGGGEFL